VGGGAVAEEEGGGDQAAVTKLYGDWQTRPWDMPAAQGGVVPKTDRGSVNVPPFATRVPQGADPCLRGVKSTAGTILPSRYTSDLPQCPRVGNTAATQHGSFRRQLGDLHGA